MIIKWLLKYWSWTVPVISLLFIFIALVISCWWDIKHNHE